MALLIEHGRPRDTPVAVVQWASLPRQRTVVGTVETIAERAKELGLPSLIIVGDVVRLRDKLRFFDARPLFGKTVLIPREPDRSQSTVERLRDASAEPLAVPAFRLIPPADAAPMHRAVKQLSSYGWVLFTSAPAVAAFWRELRAQGLDTRALGSTKVAAVGAKTAASIERHGVRVDLIGDEAHAEGMLVTLRQRFAAEPPQRVLFPRAAEGREVLAVGLRSDGHQVDVVPAYQNVPVEGEDLARLVDGIQGADAILVTSGSVVELTGARCGD